MQVLLGHGVNGRTGDWHLQVVAGEQFHDKERLIGIFDELIDPDEVGVAKLHSELGFMHECFVIFPSSARGEELFEGEPALGRTLEGLP